MKILLSNDDGYQAKGVIQLAGALKKKAEVTVVVPDKNRSGASNSLTLDQPLRVNQHENGFYTVDGTPTDCVHLAITGLLDIYPDIVISGINHGANLGDDVLYSGTVAAAMEGRFLGLPAMAVSLVGVNPCHYETAIDAVLKILEQIKQADLPQSTILNINVPNVPVKDIKGYKITRLGNRHKAEPVIKAMDPRGQPIYWVGPAGAEQDAGDGTDFYAIRNNYVSITPLHVDLTHYSTIEHLSQWLGGLTH